MKRIFLITALIITVLSLMAGCKKGGGQEIHVISREAGSGTRSAFTEIVGILTKDKDGNEVDNTYIEATIENATDAVISTVINDKDSIGYISLGSLNDSVKAIKVDGVEATKENVKDNSYKIARPFNLAYKAGIGELEKDFLDFILSDKGAEIISNEGYIPVKSEEGYNAKSQKGNITIAGSTSVTPVMEKLVEVYKKLNPNVKIDIQSLGSSAGLRSAIEGVANIAMASRELKDEEKQELEHVVIAMDGIAVIVNKENSLDDLSIEDIKNIFIGEKKSFENEK